jgi:uncharacterized protein RhaS with RHS repeats
VAYQYDGLGRRVYLTRGKGQSVAYAYDNLNRLTGVNVGSQVYSYGYAGVSSLVQSLTMPNSAITSYQYDLLNRLGQMTTSASGVGIEQYGYTYNAQDLRSAETYTESTPTYADELVNYT